MLEADLYAHLLAGVFACAALIAVLLLVLSAPYGRHSRAGWGPSMPTRLAWVVMEAPAALGFLGCYFAGAHALELAPLALMAMWQTHYLQRTFVFPFKMRPGGRTTVAVVALGFTFNAINPHTYSRQPMT